MSAESKLLFHTAALCAAALLAGVVPPNALAADSAPAQSAAQGENAVLQPGSWQPHTYQFQFMGFTATYSCDGLGDKLKLLLRLAGARPDAKVTPSCTRGYGVPDKLGNAQLEFSTLSPAAAPVDAVGADGNLRGVWRKVELAPRRPYKLEAGDCELVEQFRDTLLPMFTTRNVNSRITCVPHQSGAYNLSFEVFAPPRNSKGT